MQLSLLYSSVIAALVYNVHANGQNRGPAYFEGELGVSDSSKNPVYKVGDVVTFRWGTTYEEIGIIMWQKYPGPMDSAELPLVSNFTEKTVSWTVNKSWMKKLNDGETGVAYLALYQSGQTGLSASSHAFNITGSDDDEETTISTSLKSTKITAAGSTQTAGQTQTASGGATTITAVPTASTQTGTQTDESATSILMTAVDTPAASSSEDASSGTAQSMATNPLFALSSILFIFAWM